MRFRPALLVVVTFAALILLGIGVLRLQIHTGSQADESIITSAFTSVSAVCVTGLTVVDLSRDMEFAGQLAVLVLILGKIEKINRFSALFHTLNGAT